MSSEMPQKLKWKLMDLATETGRKRPSTARRPWVVGGLTAGFAALALGAYLLSPKPAMAKSWTLVKQAVEQVRTFQMVVHTGKEKDVRIATADGKMRVDSDDGTIVYMDNGRIQVYDPKQNTVTRVTIPGVNLGQIIPEAVGEIASHIDLKQELAKFEKEFGSDNIKISPIYSKDGRQVYDVAMRDPKGKGEALLTVDAATDLPISINANDPSEKDGQVQISLRYNDRLDLEPTFPKNVKYEDVDLGNLKGMGIDTDKISKEIQEGIANGMKNMGGKDK